MRASEFVEQVKVEAVRIDNERQAGVGIFAATSARVLRLGRHWDVVREVPADEFGEYGIEREVGKR